MSRSPHPLVPVLFGALALAGSAIPAQSAPAASPSPTASGSSGLAVHGPRDQSTQQRYERWVLKLQAGSTSAKAVGRKQKDDDAMTGLDSSDATRIRTAMGRQGAKVRRAQANANDRMTVQLDTAVDASAAQAMVGGDVQTAEPDITVSASDAGSMTSTPDDTYFSLQWAITGTHGIRADQVWPTDTGKGVTVAVLDTGITGHPDLTSKVSGGYDFISAAADARDGDGRDTDPHDLGDWAAYGDCSTGSAAENSSWHGTHVASLIGAASNNGAGIAGVAPGATIEPVRVLGRCGGTSSDIADAITWASGGTVAGIDDNPNPAKVINLSLGGSYSTCPSYYQSAINGAIARGSVVVVAAGNEDVDAQNSVPANCSGVITVAATGQDGTRASYSN